MNRIKKWMAESSPEYVIVRVSDREASFGSIPETVAELGIDFGDIPVPHTVRELDIAIKRYGGVYKSFFNKDGGAKFWIGGKNYFMLPVHPGKLFICIGTTVPSFYFARELEWEALPSSWPQYSPGNGLQSFEDIVKLARDLEKSGWDGRFKTEVTDDSVEIMEIETAAYRNGVLLTVWRPR